MLGQALGLDVESFPDLHENDRSATGFLPREEFEAVADEFFAQPDTSVLGWETAQAAQTRIVAAVRAAVALAPETPALLVGHGAVGTPLKCALAHRPISRLEDQPDGGGNHLGFTLSPDQVLYGWQPMEQAPPQPMPS
jgi:broad specificity phosphatase PhoE